jgi:hypothetical protein
MALVAPYAVAPEVPSKAFRKLAVGFLTRVCPPRTTKPVMDMKIRVKSLTSPIALEILRDQRVLKIRTTVGVSVDLRIEARAMSAYN